MINKKYNIIEFIIMIITVVTFVLFQHYFFRDQLILKLVVTLSALAVVRLTLNFFRIEKITLFFSILENIIREYKQVDNSNSDIDKLETKERNYLKSIQKIMNKNAELHKQTEATNRALKNILKINNKILEYADMDSLYKYLLQKAIATIPAASTGSLTKLNEEYTFEIIAVHKFDKSILNTKIDVYDSFIWNKTNGLMDRAVIIDNVHEFNEHNFNPSQLELMAKVTKSSKAAICAPVIIDGALLGTINVDSYEENAFTDQDADILMFFSQQISNIIKRKTILDKELYLSRYDALTNIYNRGYFNIVITEHEKKARRFKENFSVVVFDIDNLKSINTKFGHSIGDKILKSTVFTIENNIRDIDILARLSDDEFVLILPEKNILEATDLVDEIRIALKESSAKKYPEFDFSYGISSYPDESENVEKLITLADKRMFENRKEKIKIRKN